MDAIGGLFSVKMLQCVRVNVQIHGELVFACDLLVYESIQVKYDTLKVDNKHLRWFRYTCHF